MDAYKKYMFFLLVCHYLILYFQHVPLFLSKMCIYKYYGQLVTYSFLRSHLLFLAKSLIRYSFVKGNGNKNVLLFIFVVFLTKVLNILKTLSLIPHDR